MSTWHFAQVSAPTYPDRSTTALVGHHLAEAMCSRVVIDPVPGDSTGRLQSVMQNATETTAMTRMA
jgi:hypothetical protein